LTWDAVVFNIWKNVFMIVQDTKE